MLSIIVLFLLQFFRVNVLVGSLSGSLAVWFVKLIDVFAYLESLIASMDFTIIAFLAVLPVVVVYIVFGRAFCGWVCPMDFLFELIKPYRNLGFANRADRIKGWKNTICSMSPRVGYVIMGFFLIGSLLSGIPLFTNYLSHLTNFFRMLSSGVFLALDLPTESVVLFYSGTAVLFLLALEYFFPRLWCKVVCPVGKTYGLFNKISLLKLKFVEGHCGECNLCEQVCYMCVRITPYLDQPVLRDTNCIYCGRCVEGCETKGKLIKMTLKK